MIYRLERKSKRERETRSFGITDALTCAFQKPELNSELSLFRYLLHTHRNCPSHVHTNTCKSKEHSERERLVFGYGRNSNSFQFLPLELAGFWLAFAHTHIRITTPDYIARQSIEKGVGYSLSLCS